MPPIPGSTCGLEIGSPPKVRVVSQDVCESAIATLETAAQGVAVVTCGRIVGTEDHVASDKRDLVPDVLTNENGGD